MANQLKKKDSDMDAMRKRINELTAALWGLRQGADTSAGVGLTQKLLLMKPWHYHRTVAYWKKMSHKERRAQERSHHQQQNRRQH
eukprot:7002257-Ditylum_brightwellii.AAC.1